MTLESWNVTILLRLLVLANDLDFRCSRSLARLILWHLTDTLRWVRKWAALTLVRTLRRSFACAPNFVSSRNAPTQWKFRFLFATGRSGEKKRNWPFKLDISMHIRQVSWQVMLVLVKIAYGFCRWGLNGVPVKRGVECCFRVRVRLGLVPTQTLTLKKRWTWAATSTLRFTDTVLNVPSTW